MENAVALAAIGLVGTLLAVVVKPLFALLKNNTDALEKLVASNEKIAKATTKGNEEAKERNGHLGEQNVKIAEMVTEVKTTLNNQHVQEQTVEHQTVNTHS